MKGERYGWGEGGGKWLRGREERGVGTERLFPRVCLQGDVRQIGVKWSWKPQRGVWFKYRVRILGTLIYNT